MKNIGDLKKWTVNLVHKSKPKFQYIENPAGTALHEKKYMQKLPKSYNVPNVNLLNLSKKHNYLE